MRNVRNGKWKEMKIGKNDNRKKWEMRRKEKWEIRDVRIEKCDNG